MAEMNDIVKLAVDAHRGTVEKYSVKQANEALRQALIEANNGSTKLDYRAIRDGKCPGLFSIVETILANTIVDGIEDNAFFANLVDFRNVAEGDQNAFVVGDNDLFVVAETADGTQAVRRQRLDSAEVAIPTSMKTVRIYEELSRVLSGRVDFNDMIARVAASFRQNLLNGVYGAWAAATAADLGGSTYFPVAGTYSEDALLTLIEHVEAAAGGKPATIIGTKTALRQLQESIQSDGAKEELHNDGYYGKFFGTNCVAIPQRHKVGTTNFVYNNKELIVVAGDDKPVKVVYEGDPIVIMRNATENMDLTQEYFYGSKWGSGIVIAGGNSGIGRYQTT